MSTNKEESYYDILGVTREATMSEITKKKDRKSVV